MGRIEREIFSASLSAESPDHLGVSLVSRHRHRWLRLGINQLSIVIEAQKRSPAVELARDCVVARQG